MYNSHNNYREQTLMKRLLLVTAISFSSLTYADSGFYTSLKAGISDTKFEDYKLTLAQGDESIIFKHKDADESIYPNISAAIGFDFSKVSKVNARAELEYTYKDKATFAPNISSGIFNGNEEQAPPNIPSYVVNELRTQSLMLNGYYDFKNTTKFTPYLSAGLGVSRIENDISTNPEIFNSSEHISTDTNNNFAWTAGAGVAYQVTKNVALDLAYRYVDAGEIETSLSFDGANFKNTADLISHDYSLGIRYNF